ncbi:hypothetical protein D3C81_880430 [compost metagenome]
MRLAAAGIALHHRAQRQFRIAGGADLAHQQHVELAIQRARHLESHGYATARQRQHEHRLAIIGMAHPVFREVTAQIGARLAAVGIARR